VTATATPPPPADADAQVAPTPDPDSAHLPKPSPKGIWETIDKLVIVVFVLGLMVPSAILFAGFRPKPIENRPLIAMPAVRVDRLLDTKFYDAIGNFVSDNMRFRPLAVRARSEVAYALGGSTNPEVVRGADNWLFSTAELAPTCTYTAEETIQQLDATQAAFSATGQDFRFLVAPDKRVIYPEKVIPIGLPTPCTDDRRPALQAALASRQGFAIDSWRPLLAVRASGSANGPLFFGQDSHWTQAGELAALHDLAVSWSPDQWRADDVQPNGKTSSAMELAQQLGLDHRESTPAFHFRSTLHVTKEKVPVTVDLHNAKAIYHFTATGDPRLLSGRTVVVYDSFFGLHMEDVSKLFADVTWIHEGDLKNHPELAQELGPFDRIVLERVERGLYITDIQSLLAPLIVQTIN
jgi:hypothetical protein